VTSSQVVHADHQLRPSGRGHDPGTHHLNRICAMIMAGTYCTTDLLDMTSPRVLRHIWPTIGHKEKLPSLRTMRQTMTGACSVARRPPALECQQLRITTVDHQAFRSPINAGLAALSITNDCIQPWHGTLTLHLREEDICKGIWN
jgi:hypothetical protein